MTHYHADVRPASVAEAVDLFQRYLRRRFGVVAAVDVRPEPEALGPDVMAAAPRELAAGDEYVLFIERAGRTQ